MNIRTANRYLECLIWLTLSISLKLGIWIPALYEKQKGDDS